ncbi:PREDICTED: crescerin-1-like [Amphimedon queenslandica]|uniref:TOG domain-containing protein n=1 Tax=Amphimedon queenslandica TaxID=400682 RepID=A0A1X7V5Y6_AMPQE|nr:PREDICTED: crescerin-1-like [Amphimedon queenslandica]|eukprot:XP_019850510.1 PREDICTED: crescerin-1-like [Amphimedon queenslandica]
MSHHKQCTFPGRNGTRLQHQSVVSPEIMNGSTDYSAFSGLQQQDCRTSNLQSPSPPFLYINGRKSSNPNPQFLSSSPPPSLYLGLFPQRIVADIRDQSSVETRKAAINSIHGTLRDTKDKAILVESLQEIVSLVTPSLNDGNFKIVLTTLQLVDDLVSKTGSAILPFLPMLLSHYLDKVGTHKYMVKQTGMKVLLHLMTVLSPSPVINEIINFGSRHKQGKVREETLNIVIASLLTFPSSEFSLASLVEQVTPLLIDTKQTVRQACLEACAVLADRLGREQMHILLTAVLSLQRIMTNTNTENLHVAFQSRLSRKKLPHLNEDGLVNHVVNVSNGRAAPGGDRQLTGADVNWILDGKSSTLSANSRSQSTSGPLKSAGKKLPWDSEPAKSTGTTGGYASLALKQQVTASSSLPVGQSSTLGGGGGVTGASNKASKGYSDIYRTSNETGNGDSRSFQPSSIGPMKHSRVVYTGGSTVSGGGNGPGSKGIPGSSSLSTTWPRQNGSYGNNHFTKGSTARQISADNTGLSGNLLGPSKLPAIDARPSSKPIVRNPLPFHPQPPPLSSHSPPPPSFPIHASLANGIPPDSPTHIEESFLIGGNDDDDYYNIPVDDSQLNNSLSSSLTSLLFNRDMQSATASGERTPTVDSLSQIRKKAADWKAEILSVQCSASTSPTSTPPRMHKQFMINGRMEFETVSAPVALKRERPLKDKNAPMEANSFLTSPNKQQGQQQRLSGGGEGGKVGGARRNGGGGTIPRRESDPSFQSRPSELHKKQSPMKKTPLKMFKTPPRKYHQERMDEEGEGSPDLPFVHDLEANPEFISPPKLKMNPVPPGGRTIKKISPTKAASAPQKSSTSISQANSTSNSAPVYRLGSQEPLVEEEASETDARLQELSPLVYPENAMRQALEGLRKGTEEWEEKREALLVLRRLSAWHKPIIIPQLHTVLIAVEKEVKNLRSQVARSAIACLGDMFGYLAKEMEISLDALLKTLLHVGSKSNNFYREDTEKALYLACNSVSPAKCLQGLMNGGLSHGSQLIRRQVAQFMCVTVEVHGAAKIVRLPRDVLDRVINATAILLGDADPLARYQARKMLNMLYSCPEFDELARKALNDHQYAKIKETAEHIKVKGLGKPPTDSQSAKATARLSVSQYSSAGASSPGKGQSPPKVKKRRSSISGLPGNGGSGQVLIEPGGVLPPTSAPPPDSSAVLDIVSKMKATDWKERQEAINELEQYIITHPNSLGSNLVKVFDVFNERLSDKNSKVNLHALQAFQRLVPILNQQLSPVLPTLVEALSGTVASRYPAIHSAALNAIDSLMQTVDCTLLFPPLASAAQNGNARVQPIMLKKLSDLIPYVYGQKPGLVQRIGLPVLWKVLSSRSPATGEAKQAILRLTEVLQLCLGPSLQESASQLSPTQQQKLQELVQTLHLQNR